MNATIAPVNAAKVNARLDREAAAYRAGLAALAPAPEIIETEYRGIPAKRIGGAAFVAISTNARRNGAEWAILRDGDALHVDNVVCYLKRREVSRWLTANAA